LHDRYIAAGSLLFVALIAAFLFIGQNSQNSNTCSLIKSEPDAGITSYGRGQITKYTE
jgi:hypothetical protein